MKKHLFSNEILTLPHQLALQHTLLCIGPLEVCWRCSFNILVSISRQCIHSHQKSFGDTYFCCSSAQSSMGANASKVHGEKSVVVFGCIWPKRDNRSQWIYCADAIEVQCDEVGWKCRLYIWENTCFQMRFWTYRISWHCNTHCCALDFWKFVGGAVSTF